MITREILIEWVLEAVRAIGGSGHVAEVASEIWKQHEQELRAAGNLFYTWQYDMRWAAQQLRNAGKLKDVKAKRGLPWELTEYVPPDG
jgi:hypothetical protein